jgi:outer membrane murein-binding lipoprotein Lpp
MELIADILLGAGALGVAVYCHVLSRRLRAFNQLENGIGGAVAVLSAQVDDLTRTLTQARQAAQESSTSLAEKTERAEKAAAKLELMLATLHDLPEESGAGAERRRFVRRRSALRDDAGEAA